MRIGMEREEIKLAIAGRKFLIEVSGKYEVPDKGKPFIEEFATGEEDVRYVVRVAVQIEEPKGQLLRTIDGCEEYQTETGYCLLYRFQSYGVHYQARLEINCAQALCYLDLPQEALDFAMKYLFSFLGLDYVFFMLHRVYMHGALARYQGSGIIFTGPSGIGKSTQSGLWERHLGAEILNGDRVLMEFGEQVIGHGSLAAGSSNIYRKEQVPIRAIVMLSQAKENRIERLTGMTAFKTMFPRFMILPAPECMKETFDLVQRLVQEVPIYHLACLPDEDAVELTRKTIFG